MCLDKTLGVASARLWEINHSCKNLEMRLTRVSLNFHLARYARGLKVAQFTSVRDQWGLFHFNFFYYLFECGLAPPWIGSSRGQWWREGGNISWSLIWSEIDQQRDFVSRTRRKVLNRDSTCFVNVHFLQTTEFVKCLHF